MTRPANYEFTGWDETPVDLFDAGEWAKCLHATMQAYNVANDPEATQRAIADTGVLHELAHLAIGEQVCTHTSMAELRGWVKLAMWKVAA